MNAFANVGRATMAAGLIFLSHPAMALYAQVKPTLKVGADCVGRLSPLAPKLMVCTITSTRMRIWCPNGEMYEGATEQGGLAASLARSLCDMAQVSE
jgi:hypothetical protein